MYPLYLSNFSNSPYSAFNVNPYTYQYMASPLQNTNTIPQIQPISPIAPIQRDTFSYSNNIDNESTFNQDSTKTAGLAAILHLITLGLQKASSFLSAKLSAGKEFASADNVNAVAEEMVRKNNLDVAVEYIDDVNKGAISAKYGLGKELDVVAKGQNAFFADRLKLAVAPKSKPSLILHELGHAINAKGFFTSMLQKTRAYARFAPMALVFANGIFTNKDDGKKSFVERHAGLLGFSAFLPTIIEEGIASYRGISAAKKVLNNPATLNILKKNYAFALGTYILAGIGLGVAAKQAVSIDGKKEAEKYNLV